MVIREIIKKVTDMLRESSDNAIFEAHLIVREVLDLEPLDIVIGKNNEVDRESEEKILNIAKRCTDGEPIQYILGNQEFMSLSFKVTPDVLIPRADTETLVEYIIEKYKNKGVSALDIGTGSGCIGISLAVYNKRAYIRAVDVSEKALKIAKENAENNGVDDRIVYVKCDIMKDRVFGRYDLIVSNPPYIETDVIPTLDKNVRDFEPHLALDGGADGLDFYRHIIDIAPFALNENGMLAFEVGHTQAGAVARLMEKDFVDIEIINDLCGIARVVAGKKR